MTSARTSAGVGCAIWCWVRSRKRKVAAAAAVGDDRPVELIAGSATGGALMTFMRAAAGIASALFGVVFLLYIYAFASMVNPSLTDHERRVQIMEKMFLQSGVAEGTYIGLTFVAAGLWLVVGRPRPWVGRRAEPVATPDPVRPD